ncbi:SDR family NAD(P)-dependent oxidoreductase [Paenibacillus jiagnxiensis]|uniref:SDR family NAD(P)-dependent oxidoreductase n=1 Tax=Paenibacillus jiagnxiensis TaxID=3228926 RepID=UPI0038D3C6BF
MYKGKTALITGASSGIGASFAHELAAKGMNLIVVARSEDKLQKLANTLTTKYKVRVDAVIADLTEEHAAQVVYNCVKELHLNVDLLVNNAGVASYGLFEELDLKRQQNEIKLNVLTVVSLTHLFLQDMLKRKKGAIINVASTSGFQPMPYMAVYSATKSFVVSWSEALWAETRDKGISVVTLSPGRTDTNIFEVMGNDGGGLGKKTLPINVVRTGLRALEKGKMTVVDGKGNYWRSQVYRFLPRKAVVSLIYCLFGKSAS